MGRRNWDWNLWRVLLRLAAPAAAGFCGADWGDADDHCWKACARDEDCAVPWTCHEYTACDLAAADGDDNDSADVAGPATDAADDGACGATWVAATSSCAVPCPLRTECPPGQSCHLATNCKEPINPILSRQILSLTGELSEAVNMDAAEQEMLGASVLGVLESKLLQDKVLISSTKVTGQSSSAAQRLLRWNDGRSASLDVSMNIEGGYRPPPYLDVDLLIEESINSASRTLVRDVQDRGRRAGSQFFEQVDGLEAVRASATTPRPTARPTRPPTPQPTAPPTAGPTAPPTPGSVQVAAAGAGAELYVGTSKSYGIVFEVRTQPDAETLRVQGLDIYASVEGEVEYEVRSKEGGWEGFEGDEDAFPVVAAGTAYSRGKCDADTADCGSHFARIRGDFADMGVRGGGGSRSFYVALTARELLYSSAGADDPEVLVETPGEATPVRFVVCCCVSARRSLLEGETF